MGNVRILSVFKIAGAYVAYVIGSGFATGQEIVHFFTVYGLESTIGIIISGILFALAGGFMISDGVHKGSSGALKIYNEYCGIFIGFLFNMIVPVLLFGSVVIMLAGSAATFEEYFGINYETGALVMALTVYLSYLLGIRKIVSIMGIFGPAVIMFSVIVGVITFINSGGVSSITDCESVVFGIIPPADTISGSAILYVSYNISTAAVFFRALGESDISKREAWAGSFLGAGLLMLSLLSVNLALLSQGNDIAGFAIPTLHLAREISPILGTLFSIILLIEIYSTAVPMMWSVCSRIAPEGSISAMITGAVFITIAIICSFTPFEELIGVIYPYEGRIGLVFLICLLGSKLKGLIISFISRVMWYN
ncbi:MAG: hypothetical protein IJF28_04520 [Firmicutes bacterium]|nr:hypothetical protein [Bacillota bacterium]